MKLGNAFLSNFPNSVEISKSLTQMITTVDLIQSSRLMPPAHIHHYSQYI